MAELALLGVVAMAIALHRLNERLCRVEETVRALQRFLAGQPKPAPDVPLAPAPVPAPAPAPPWSPPPVSGPVWDESTKGWTPPPAATREPSEPQPARRREPIRLQAFGNRTIEQLVSENLVAIVGGLLVVAGVVFFLSLAISRGWIGETGRVVIALVFGSALVASGLRLGSRAQGETTSGRPWAVGSLHGVLCGAGIAVLFLSSVVGTRVYDVLGWAGLPLAVAVGALATVVAVKWQSQDLAGLGIGGALAAPILVDAPADGSTAAFVVVALLASSAVLVLMGWPWLLAVTLVTTAPQVAAWIAPVAGHSLLGDLGVLAAWNAAILTAAVAAELRQPAARLRASLASISFLTASIAGVLGAREVERHGSADLAWWLPGLPPCISWRHLSRGQSTSATPAPRRSSTPHPCGAC